MKVQLVTAYRVSHLHCYDVTVRCNVTSVEPPLCERTGLVTRSYLKAQNVTDEYRIFRDARCQLVARYTASDENERKRGKYRRLFLRLRWRLCVQVGGVFQKTLRRLSHGSA